MFIPLTSAAGTIAVAVTLFSNFKKLRRLRQFICVEEGRCRDYRLVFLLSALYFVPFVAITAVYSSGSNSTAYLSMILALASNVLYLPAMTVATIAARHFDVHLDRQLAVRKYFLNIRFAGFMGATVTLVLPLVFLLGALGVTAHLP